MSDKFQHFDKILKKGQKVQNITTKILLTIKFSFLFIECNPFPIKSSKLHINVRSDEMFEHLTYKIFWRTMFKHSSFFSKIHNIFACNDLLPTCLWKPQLSLYFIDSSLSISFLNILMCTWMLGRFHHGKESALYVCWCAVVCIW